MNMKQHIILVFLCMASCNLENGIVPGASRAITFSPPQKVTITGYSQDIMEPFITRDNKYLFFNNLNDPAVTNTNLYYATRINDTTFQYQGEINGVNSPALDAVATLDSVGNFYCISTRSYDQSLSTIYGGVFDHGNVRNLEIVPGISLHTGGMVNFDVEISADGNTLYFVDGRFNNHGQLLAADLAIAVKNSNGFSRAVNSDELLKNINTSQMEYAAGISKDECTLFFTRVAEITPSAKPRIFYATRSHKNEPFSIPVEIQEIEGFAEAATISGDSLIYYHKRENGHYALYCVKER